MKKRFLSMLLAVAMALTIVPSTAIAMAVEPETSPAQGGLDAGESVAYLDPDEYPTNEELLEGYIWKMFSGDTGEAGSFSTGDQTAGMLLTGTAKTIYDAVAPEIVKIAAQGGSTKFTNPGNVTSGITNEISKQVLDALCFDYPYEMYWRGLEYGGGYSNEFNLYVAEEYKGANNQTVDAEKAKKASDIISNASGNAQKILNAAKDLPSPIAKLQYFKKAICDLVSYNHDAVENNTTYGNPWQMIWVFDGDPQNQVVCEGYAKAFQYLCDQAFPDGPVQCYTVTGLMSGGTGAGPHMWNIVTIDNKNYLVDVTNCDGDSVGAPDYLFLVGGTRNNGTEYDYKIDIPGQGSICYAYDADLAWNNNVLTLAETNYEDPAAPRTITLTLPTQEVSTTSTPPLPGYYVPEKTESPKALQLNASLGKGETATDKSFDWSITPAQEGITLKPGTDGTATLEITNENIGDGTVFTVTVSCSTTKDSKQLCIFRKPATPTILEVRNPDNQAVGPNGTTAYNIESGKTMTFTAKVLDQYGTEMADQAEKVKWTVNELDAKGSVNNGAVTANADAKNGDEFSVTVSVEGSTVQEQSIAFTVKAPATPLTEVTLEYTAPADLTYDGQPKTPTIALHDGNSSLVKDTDYTVTYKRANGISNDTTNAGTITVEIKGIGNYTGTLTRTYTIEKFQPTITPEPKTISDLYVGGTATFTVTATGHTTGTNLLNDLQVTSSSTGVATVTYNNGTATVTAVKDGTATITVSYPGNTNYKAASATVTVKVNARPPVATVSINGLDNGKAVFGDELTANASAESDAGTLEYQWYRGETAITGAASQTYTVVKEDIGKKLSVKVTGANTNYDPAASAEVEAVAVEVTVNVTLTPASVEVGGTARANVTVTPTNGKNKGIDLTSPAVTYKSSDTSVATVDTSGNVTALKAGTTDITAAYAADGYKTAEGSAPLTVTKKSLEDCTFTITLNQDSFTYTGSEQKAAVTSVVAACRWWW